MNNETLRFIRYLSFKMDCLREQEANPLTLDVELCEKYLSELEQKKEEKVEALKKAMPKNPITKKKEKPYEDGNPNSTDQVKSWLFSLGWKPRTWKYVRNKETGEERRIEQVRKDGHLCESVKELSSKDSAIELLDGLSVITHRIGVLKGFLKNSVEVDCEYCWGMGQFLDEEACDGDLAAIGDPSGRCLKCYGKGKTYKVVSSAGGFTNTLRLQHRAPVVNLPGVEAEYGEWCRGVLVPEVGKVMVGADVVSLEDTLKQHFIQPYDPEYVEEMDAEGFDPHVSLAVEAGRVTQEEYNHYVECKNNGNESDPTYQKVHKIRKPFKTVNYAAQYSVGKKTLARNSGMTEKEAQADLGP